MVDLIAEADEALKQERFEKFWKDYGGLVIGFIILTILGTGVFSAYKAWDRNERLRSTDAVLALMEDDAFPENIDSINLDEVRADLRGLALLNAAAVHLKQGKTEQALDLYKRVSKDTSVEQVFQDLAAYAAAQLSSEEFSGARIKTLANTPSSPWQVPSQFAMADALAAEGEFEKALSYLSMIEKTPDLPESVYARARALEQIYIVRQHKQNGNS